MINWANSALESRSASYQRVPRPLPSSPCTLSIIRKWRKVTMSGQILPRLSKSWFRMNKAHASRARLQLIQQWSTQKSIRKWVLEHPLTRHIKLLVEPATLQTKSAYLMAIYRLNHWLKALRPCASQRGRTAAVLPLSSLQKISVCATLMKKIAWWSLVAWLTKFRRESYYKLRTLTTNHQTLRTCTN